MELNEFLAHLNRGEAVTAGSAVSMHMHRLSEEAMRITAELNCGYHEPQEISRLFSRLIGKPVSETFRLFPPFHTDCGKNISLGEYVFINSGCHFQDQGGITLGSGVLVGHGVTIVTLNHDFAPSKRSTLHPSPVVVGDNVWIGSNATILPGVRIGSGSIIAAGAVVTKDVPSNTIAAGVPAKVIRELTPEELAERQS